MSNKNEDGQEVVEYLDDDVMETGQAGPEKRSMKTITKVLLGGAAMALVVGFALFKSAPSSNLESHAIAPAAMDSTPGGAIQGKSEVYQESLRAKNKDLIDKASKLGLSAIPTPEVVLGPEKDMPIEPIEKPARVKANPAKNPLGNPQPKPQETVIKTVIPAPPAAPQRPTVVEKPAANPAASQTQQQPHAFFADMSNFIASTNPTLKPGKMESAALIQPETGQTNNAPANAVGNTMVTTPVAATNTDLIVRPGDIIYAETITSVNSDSKTPVLAEVTTGSFKGARLVGTFSADKSSGKLVVSFSSMTMEDGTVYPINALAVDGRSAETAVASDVNHRFIKRYAPLLAASFISGYAASEAKSNQTVVDSGSSTQIVTAGSTAKQSLMAGLATASSAVAKDVASYAAQGPLISLRDGYPIAVLMLDPVSVAQSVQETGVTGSTTVPRPGSASQLPTAMFTQPISSSSTTGATKSGQPQGSNVMSAPVIGG